MGLDVSHDCWSGPYSSFMRFRCALARAAWGVDLFTAYNDETQFAVLLSDHADDPIMPLINHSDCDGILQCDNLLSLAERLDALAPKLDTGPNPQVRLEPFSSAARKFAAGCRAAHAAGEDVVFS
jgi:hypothetical protein